MIMEKFAKLKGTILAIEAEAVKFYERGNRAAGTRLRKSLQEIKGLSQHIRQEVTTIKNS